MPPSGVLIQNVKPDPGPIEIQAAELLHPSNRNLTDPSTLISDDDPSKFHADAITFKN
jgi:hypothetical protein